MSDHIPFEIQVEIIKRLPVISLLQCRTVSKTWKSLIDSSQFVTRYCSQQKHLLVRYRAPDYTSRYVSVVDDHTFPLNSVFLTRPRKYEHYYVIGCCHGLLCFYSAAKSGCMAAIWNPSIRRAYEVAVPNVADQWGVYDTALGFGVCPVTKDPKIVKITYAKHDTKLENVSSIPFQVEVFMLSTGAWRTLSTNLPRISVYFCDLVEIDGVVYWLGADRITIHGGLCYLIMSFDITREEFEEINLPNMLARSTHFMTVSKLRESPVLIEYTNEPNRMVYNLWILKGGLFTQLYTFNFNTPDQSFVIMGFRNSGEPIIERIIGDRADLVVYAIKAHGQSWI